MSLLRLLGVWALLAALMSANGVFRELVIRPELGPQWAEALSAVLGIVIILAVTRYFFGALAGYALASLAFVSAVLVGLTVVFELVVGRLVDDRSWAELAGNYAIWRGKLWPLVLLTLALTPFLWGRWFQRR